MSSYRIAPDGVNAWKVQSRFLGLFWMTLSKPIGYGYSEYLSFDTEEAAQDWIDKALDFDRRNREWWEGARERKRNVHPREYP